MPSTDDVPFSDHVRIIPLPNFNLSPLRFLEIARLARQVFEESDFVFVWGVWGPLEGLLLRWLRPTRTPCAIKTVGMLQDYIMSRNRGRKFVARRLYLDANLRRARTILVDSEPEKARVRSLGFTTPITLCRNGVEVPESLGAPRSRTILYLGRIVPKKGLDLLLEAMPGLLRTQPDVKLVVAGEFDDGEYESLIHAKIREYDLAQAVLFAGQVSGLKKLQLLQQAGCFALPSHSEGFSNAVLEALAAGTPVFITPGCNFPEVETDALGRILPRDPVAWSASLGDFFSPAACGIKSAEEIRAYVRQNFNWEQSARVLLELARSPAKPTATVP
jgi:poly(glycerol-phosphate) alpha-glucosyltransferase